VLYKLQHFLNATVFRAGAMIPYTGQILQPVCQNLPLPDVVMFSLRVGFVLRTVLQPPQTHEPHSRRVSASPYPEGKNRLVVVIPCF
jgi:hypothetical protein